MKFLGKIFKTLFYSLLPLKLRKGFETRAAAIGRAFTSNLELRIFWRVVFFPIVLPLSLIIACFKSIALLVSPSAYCYLMYIVNQMYTDVIRDKRSLKLTWKRAALTFELFVKGRERHVSYGTSNPDKTFYVIRPYYYLQPNELIFRNIANLLTQYYYVLQKLSYAVENGYIPVVDWKNYGKLAHSEDFPVNGTENAWEYYWKQPSEYTLEEVYQSQNVILSTQNVGQYGYIPGPAMRPPFMQYVRQLAEQCPPYASLVPLNEITAQYVQKYYDQLFPRGEKVLGVVIRGAAYGQTKTPMHSHPRQVKINELIRAVRKYCEEWEINYVYFINEMQELVDAMKEAFGDHLIVLPRLRDTLDRPADGVTKNPMYAPGQRYQANLDYLTEVALLSRCSSLVGSMSSGMRTAIIWNAEAYEHVVVFEKGLW